MGNSYFEGGQAPAPPAPALGLTFTRINFQLQNNADEQTVYELTAGNSTKKRIHYLAIDITNLSTSDINGQRYLKVDQANYRAQGGFGNSTEAAWMITSPTPFDFDAKWTVNMPAPEGSIKSIPVLVVTEDLEGEGAYQDLTFNRGSFSFQNNTNEQTLIEVTATPAAPKRVHYIAFDYNALIGVGATTLTWKRYFKIDGTNYRFVNEHEINLGNLDIQAIVVITTPFAIDKDFKLTLQINSAPGGIKSIPYVVVTEDVEVAS